MKPVTLLVWVSCAMVAVTAQRFVKPEAEPNAEILKAGEGENKMKEIAEWHNKRQCARGKGMVDIPRSRASVRFSRVKDVNTIVKKLILEYCSLAAVMKENKMDAPLYVEVGLSNDDLFLEALKNGCRAKIYRASTKYHKQAKQSLEDSGLEAQASLYKKALSDKPGTAKFRMAGDTDDGLLGSRIDKYIPGGWERSAMVFTKENVEVSTLESELKAEDVIPIVMVDGKGWDINILNGAMALLDTHKIQAMIFRLWPTGIRDANSGNLPKKEITDLLYQLHRRGYYFYQTKPYSLNLNDVPHGPPCADNLIDYLDHSDTLDAYGASTYLIAIK
eukprot:TRINITY_DN7470_c0_g1_i1.p1 TRINITY_DN7470_c0_g1~~TRINITY_DN7470_c0_g1_i1.p1  ORF type:complete len:333 (+),score=87.15 TRINITY_DN7470_c0_g1_i1:46-1044(+)